MTDEGLLAKKLAFVETCLSELKVLARPEIIEVDVKERRFVEHTLQICLQAIQDTASHIVSDARLGEPRTNAELFSLLAGAGYISDALSAKLRAAVGFRNVLVHGYTAVDPRIVRDVVENHLEEMTEFVTAIRLRLK